jgi:hypothetical protein
VCIGLVTISSHDRIQCKVVRITNRMITNMHIPINASVPSMEESLLAVQGNLVGCRGEMTCIAIYHFTVYSSNYQDLLLGIMDDCFDR